MILTPWGFLHSTITGMTSCYEYKSFTACRGEALSRPTESLTKYDELDLLSECLRNKSAWPAVRRAKHFIARIMFLWRRKLSGFPRGQHLFEMLRPYSDHQDNSVRSLFSV